MAEPAVDLREQVAALRADPDLLFVPVRHHSPQCARATRAAIEDFEPDAVLIEGPSEANHLLSLLADESAEPPLAVYVYAVESKAARGRPVRYRCFAPLAAMSPEWVALRSAARLGAETRFIDLPYADQLACRASPERDVTAREPLFSDDGLLVGADPLARLVAEAGARDFDEWWDRVFESGRSFADAAEFCTEMHHFCAMLRLAGGAVDAETAAREAHMAREIRAARADGKRCVVVTGGFHALGIRDLLGATDDAGGAGEEAPRAGEEAPRAGAALETGVHIVRYSLARLGSACGYAAGLPDVGYYHLAWQMLNRRREPQPFAASNRVLALTLARELRRRGLPATLPDAIEAVALGERLAALRGVRPGRAELRDGALSAFVKQPLAESEAFARALHGALAGDAVGRLPHGVPLAPLVEDFRRQCRRLGLPVSAKASGERALDIYRSERHRAVSRFLHRLAFLDVPYAERLAGPDFAAGADLGRVREVWLPRWQIETEAALTERSHLGGSLQEAAAAAVLAALDAPGVTGPERTGLFLASLSMGLHDLLAGIVAELERWIRVETNAVELGAALVRLVPAWFARSALGAAGHLDLDALLRGCFERFCLRLAWTGQLPEEQEDALADVLRAAFGLVEQDHPWADAELLLATLASLDTRRLAPRLDGIVAAILMLSGREDGAATAARLRGAFGRASVEPAAVGRFMEGFLLVGRARLGQEPSLVELVTEQMLAWDETEFLEALPAMRLAFAQLAPAQRAALADRLAGGDPSVAGALDAEALRVAAELRDALEPSARAWGLAP